MKLSLTLIVQWHFQFIVRLILADLLTDEVGIGTKDEKIAIAKAQMKEQLVSQINCDNMYNGDNFAIVLRYDH